jgi:hypothetical protein
MPLPSSISGGVNGVAVSKSGKFSLWKFSQLAYIYGQKWEIPLKEIWHPLIEGDFEKNYDNGSQAIPQRAAATAKALSSDRT